MNEQLAKDLKRRILKDNSLLLKIHKIVGFLPNSEYELILYMIEKNAWKGPIPAAPKDFEPGEGSVEFGLFLYWFHNPKLLTLEALSNKEKNDAKWIIFILTAFLPNSKMDKQNYNFLCVNELIFIDGTVLSTKKYATYDQGWFVAFLNLFITLFSSLFLC